MKEMTKKMRMENPKTIKVIRKTKTLRMIKASHNNSLESFLHNK
jgi:hypothetical protein